MPAAVGIQVLEMLERDHLAARAKKLGDIFQAFLRDLQGKYTCIGDVRGQGLMVGMEIVKPGPLREPDDELGTKLADRMLELGLSANVVSADHSLLHYFNPFLLTPIISGENAWNIQLLPYGSAFNRQ